MVRFSRANRLEGYSLFHFLFTVVQVTVEAACYGSMAANVNGFLCVAGSLGSDGGTLGNLASEIMPTEFT